MTSVPLLTLYVCLSKTNSLRNHKLFVTKFTVVICEGTGEKAGILLATAYNLSPNWDQFLTSWCVRQL
jgi:hypothetical protein